MAPETLTTLGTVISAVLGGGAITAITGYLRDRRKDKGDFTVSTFTTLKEMNDRLNKQVAELQTLLDTERAQRRDLEDTVARERRERRSLEDRVSALERELATRNPGEAP
ncbi:hypothetical protein Ssi03_56790 [Sphaerisporangium siamense]|uniref:Septal ring factor EnvC (AmiA/AmiB activator) n=1 Tax=Sphaerisporangium siamense TaxID=795645 RepID=A0A7W7D4Q4_9ACTN|nr:hypothetical protein [Sphaerisporangium siamense]MBB4700274.1 septal ring factor EnvC (AmiA/AmiB activator) [Sphaerisporangium siamense]GII87689.1 hypothetical protein Ssi03_56790 [Sphaerisporangium siamense]